ncbi:MAG: alpha/beta hydrolase [Marinicaulis sp.]|nr:alpha/beta hydrolase [Marinicaulis sp.]NNL89016.1 alpha/beta hydrolase [Marinicaulis sp.]
MTFLIGLSLLFIVLGAVSGCASWQAEKRHPMIGELVDANGVEVHILQRGVAKSNHPTVVLIHGASANLLDLKMSLGEALAQDRTVLIVDRAGHGYSERPKNGHELDVQAQTIRDALHAMGIERPIIVGQSFGGAVALNYALQFQDEIAGLVVLAAVSHEWPGGVAWYNEASGIPVIGFILRRFIVPVYGRFVLDNGIDETFEPDAAPANYAERSGLALLFRPGNFKSNASDIRNLKDEIKKQQDRYGELRIPVAVVTGLSDTTVSPEIHSKTLAMEVEGADLTLLPDTGHALHHSETARIVEIINSIATSEAPNFQLNETAMN